MSRIVRCFVKCLVVLAACLVFIAPKLARAQSPDDPTPVGVARVSAGPTVHMEHSDIEVHAGVDATLGVLILPPQDYVIGPAWGAELGYTYDSVGLHAFDLAGGIGIGNAAITAMYHPHLIAGTYKGDAAVGMRNGLGIHVLMDLFSLEAAHQVVYDGRFHHDIQVVAGINPLAIASIIISQPKF